MPNVSATNKTSSSITVAGHKTYYIDSADAEIVEVEGQVGAISNTVAIYIRGYKCGYDITLTQSGYENFSGVLACEFKGVIYTNYQQTTTQACNYSGNVTFTNGSGTVEVAPFSWTYYGDSITQHDCTDNTSVKYNAFKYTLSGTPYWYVIDGEHDTWTDDLSEWGYSEVQPVETLPTVTTEGDFSSYNWLRVSSAESVSGGGNTSNLTTDGTDYPDYNTGDSYAILQWQQSGGTTSGRVEFSIVNANGKIQAHNNTSGALTFYQARVAVCSDSTATVVTVYNSSNVAYNAFKFTANNTDYYYVLDGTQTDWTDDLSGIGYSLYVKAWFTSDKSGKSIDTSYPGNSGLLYDSQGAFIDFQSGSTYTTVAVYNTSQQAVSGIDSSNFTLEDNGGGYLSFKNRSSKAPTVLYVEYTVS